jgi:S1-C subfamily serine protease
MGKTIAAIAGGVAVGIVVAFASAGAFQFPWGSDTTQQGKPTAPAPAAQTAQSHQPAPPNAPEPNEPRQGGWIAMPSWAPMVKKVMPTVVNVAITQEVKTGGPSEGDEGPGRGPETGPGSGGNPFGPGNPFGGGGGGG